MPGGNGPLRRFQFSHLCHGVTEQAYDVHEQDLKGCIKVHLVFVETGSP